ncbi:MAG: hypothetical protein MSH55_07120 [Enorma sp.]|uniref:MSCRAMM family protein n=1 Tax=Enorma sp. TaxID=1920692 RepID=UPI00258F20F9|nr:SpaA isopeptide-forming pilin-related protein [Enorma sp.]MCI7775530.1 hypothetical protein [Enorma sp.]
MHSSKRRGGFKRGGPRIAMQLIRRIAPPVGGGWNGVAAALIAVALVALSVVAALAPSTAQALADIPASFNQNVTVTRRDIGASNRSPISNWYLSDGTWVVCGEPFHGTPDTGDVYGPAVPVSQFTYDDTHDSGPVASAPWITGSSSFDPHAMAYAAAYAPTSALGQATYGFSGRSDQLVAAWEVTKHLLMGASVEGESLMYNGGTYTNIYRSTNDGSTTGRVANAAELAKIQRLVADARAHAGQSGWWDDALWLRRNLTDGSAQNIFVIIPVEPDVTVNFTKVSADAEFTAGNEEYAYSGAVYDIYRVSDNSKVTTITTDENGHADYRLAYGSYYAVETKAPQGFKLNAERIYFDVTSGNSSEAVNLEDDPGRVILRIEKKDSATLGPAQPGATLEGAEYEVTDANGDIHTGATDKNGRLIIQDIPLGQITVKETKAPTGYKLDPTVYTYTVHADQITNAGVIELEPEDDFKESVIAFDIEVAKFKGADESWDEGDGHEEPAAGVRFEIVSNTTGKAVGSITTGEDGFAETDGLWFGEGERPEGVNGALPYDAAGYTVREVDDTVPDGFDKVGDWTISAEQMADGAKLRYILNDQAISTRIQIVKQDAETGQAVPLAGFTFQILDAECNPVSMTDSYPNPVELTEFTTDESGCVTLPETLEPGEYSVHEVAAAPPYLTGGEDVALTVSGDHEDAVPTAAIVYSDAQAKGRATVAKRCSAPDGSDEGRVHDEGCTGELAGAEFDVVAMEDVVSPDGTVRATEGEVVDHVTTGEDGTATTDELYLGDGSATYAFIETKAPEGHVLDAAPHEFTLSYADDDTALVEVELEVTDAYTEVMIDKDIMGTGHPLAGATFQAWEAGQEIDVEPDDGMAAAAVRTEGESAATLTEAVDNAAIEADVPEGYRLTVSRDDYSADVEGSVAVDPGAYEIALADADGEAIDMGEEAELEVEAGEAVKVSWSEPFLIFGGLDISRGRIERESYELRLDEGAGALIATDVPAGTYELEIDGEGAGRVELTAGKTFFGSYADGKLTIASHLLKPGEEHIEVVTDDDGTAAIRHLSPGSYRLEETDAPDGFLVDEGVHYFSVVDDGLTEGLESFPLEIEDDYTKIDLSKRDITNEDEVTGAKLAVICPDGGVAESWTSDGTDHRIDALEPGDYKLVELMTPHGYDEATAVDFTVEPTGEVQRVVMYDEPIAVEGSIDKRQEVADPTHPHTDADTNAARAEVSESDDGSYDYSVDFRNESSTWVDEFTVTDEISAASDGLAELTGIVTPVAGEDYDGLLNVWYRTSTTPADYVDPSGANATRSDGHANPWLDHETTEGTLGDDSRAIDYTGWRLWAQDVNATEATELSVADLGLEEGERVIAVRLEYGRVEENFSSRTGEWERDDLKHERDDVDNVAPAHEGDEFEGAERAPLVLHMRVTDRYRDDTELVNSARVDLYRNGGNTTEDEDLEDHDSDHVEQAPVEAPSQDDTPPADSPGPTSLARTGAVSAAGVFAAIALAAGTGWWILRHRDAAGQR